MGYYCAKAIVHKFADPVYSGFLFYNQPIEIIDLKVTKKTVKQVKLTKNSTRPYLNEIPAHFIHEIKTKGYDAIGVNVFPHKLMRSSRKKGVTSPYYTTELQFQEGHYENYWVTSNQCLYPR